jgi:ATP-binding cassette subfamily B protein
MNDNDKIQKKSSALGNILNLLPFFRPYKQEVFWVMVALLVTAVMVLFFGRVIKYLIDLGFASKNNYLLDATLLSFVCGVLAMAVAGYYRSSLINSIAEKVVADLKKKIYNHIVQISSEFFEVTKAGDLISRLTTDTIPIYNLISESISFSLRNILLFVGGITLLFLTSFKLTLISLGLIPIAIAPIFIIGRKIKIFSKESEYASSSVTAHIEETISGIKTIQSYLCEAKEMRNFDTYINQSLLVTLKKTKIRSLLIALVIALAFGAIAVVLLIGGHDVLKGKMTSGDLSSFIFYSVITATSLVSISQITGQLQTASSACGRIFEFLTIKSPVEEVQNPIKLENNSAIKIVFDKVDFAYPSRKDRLILRDFNLEIYQGQKVAIIGSSGCGKSTILQLLMRFYDVSLGAIKINDINIKDLSLGDLRKNFAYISQDCFIFSGTIFENIAYVNKDITKKEVEEIIAKNEALQFINRLPEKLDSTVGQKGIKLSGGERQRIAIARAIIKNSPILLLDEATSALDNQNEQAIVKTITEISKDKTVITIAHKLSSIAYSNKIVFIKDGQIVEAGTQKELLESGGFYKKMYEAEIIGVYNVTPVES